MAQLQKELVGIYSVNDPTFAEKANKMMNEFFAKMPPSTSKTDPNRLGSRSTMTCRLRNTIIEKAGPMVDDHPEAKKSQNGASAFNEMGVKEQLQFQARARMSGTNTWVYNLEIIPSNLAGLGLSAKDRQTLFDHRAQVDGAKLQAPVETVDCEQLLRKFCPALSSVTAKRHEIVAALLLVTGRRTTEIIKTAELKLAEGQTSDGYACIFSGQLKAGLNSKPYAIPLLAPYWLVSDALKKVKQMYDAADMSTEACNIAFSNPINKTTKNHGDLTPHQLRTVYALATYNLADKKPSIIGWISKVLGHSEATNAAYYQRMKVTNAAIWTGERPVEEEVEGDDVDNGGNGDKDGWVVKGVVEKKRLVGIKEMMEHKIRLTASSIRAKAGGTISVAARIIANNREKIDEYNASLED